MCVRENALAYLFDVRRLMFSAGNVSEKARCAAGFRARGAAPAPLAPPLAGETIADLFCGMGYFTVPALVHGGAALVHACDWNAHATHALRANLAANGVAPARCVVHEGDNAGLAEPARGLLGCAHRVLLGLIPSSARAWPTAVRLLRDEGGWLHVHANKGEEEVEAFARVELPRALARLAAEAGRPAAWRFAAAHVERVKSFAPRVWHIVVDVRVAAAE